MHSHKVIEHIVYSSISHHLESHNILTPRQHGFRPGHSCESQLIISVDDWAHAINSRIQVDVAILDFSKAFDIVAHERLKSKLRSYGIADGTFLWISFFLESRKQRVVINGTSSKWTTVESGVP